MSTILKWALIFLLISLVAALFGFTDIAAASADIARVLQLLPHRYPMLMIDKVVDMSFLPK